MGIFDREIDNYLQGKETNPYGTIGTQVDSYIQGKNQPSYGIIGDAANNYIKGEGSVSGKFGGGNFLNKYGSTLFGGLGGLALGALNSSNKKNLIKSSYYKNPYLASALTPEYSLSDNINNLVGTYGMLNQGGPSANIGGKISNLFSGSLVNSLKGLLNKKTNKNNYDLWQQPGDDLDGVIMSGDNNPPIIIPTTQEEDRFV